MRSLTVAVIVAAGCGGSSSAPVTIIPDSQPVPWGKGQPLVTPGERMTYRLSLRGFELASYTLAVGEITALEDKQTIVVEGHAKSVERANMPVDARFTSWIDVETGRSHRFKTAELAAGVEHTVIDFAKREGATVPVSFHVDEAPASDEPQTVTQPDVWDHNAFLLALRAWEAPAGATLSTEVFHGRALWKLDVTVRGTERLTTQLGILPALRFDGRAVELARDGTQLPAAEARAFSIWIGDEGERVPLRTTAQTEHGHVELVIVAYQSGIGPRLRPR